jgi:hypothetical protein
MTALPPQVEDDEAFYNAFRVYFMTVEILAAQPDEQCSLMGDYNVAWELKDDAQAGLYLLKRGYLSEGEEEAVTRLSLTLNEVDTQSLPAGPGRAVNLQAMQHPTWMPVRAVAAETILKLAAARERNAKLLGGGTSAA